MLPLSEESYHWTGLDAIQRTPIRQSVDSPTPTMSQALGKVPSFLAKLSAGVYATIACKL